MNAPYKDAGTRAAESAANVDAARLVQADQDPGNWMTYGRTYSEQRFSPLTQITADNVNLLGLAWYADFDIDRGQEATPLVIDGVMYVSTAWSMVRRSPPAVSYSLSSVASATAMQRWAAG